jgi:glucose-1-phosphate cytidylyltransferase
MKVVLFCGGLGMRLREFSETTPKPLVDVGQRPVLWHLMKYYSHYGHNDFVLCLGYGAHKIKDFFLHYDEWATNDFVLADGGRHVQMLGTDIDDWRITFVDTGADSNIGERLRRVRRFIGDDEMFLANYADGLSDLPLDSYVDNFSKKDRVACFLSVPLPQSFHVVHTNESGDVTGLEPVATSRLRINAGYFVLRREIFDYMKPGEELVSEPFARLVAEQRLLAYPYDGFWRPMDTFKDKLELDRIATSGDAPWQVWQKGADESAM